MDHYRASADRMNISPIRRNGKTEEDTSEPMANNLENLSVNRPYRNIFGVEEEVADTDHVRFDQFLLRKTTPPEVKLLHLIERGNVQAVANYLKKKANLNINYEVRWNRYMASPLHIAAEGNNIHMMDLLFRHNAKPLKKPERIHQFDDYDGLLLSFQKLKYDEARSSEGYIALTSDDVLTTAFQLRHELAGKHFTSKIEGFYINEYKAMHHRMEQFAIDLLRCCDGLDEVRILLHGRQSLCMSCCEGTSNTGCVCRRGRDKWLNLYKAIETDHKTFIADEQCQQVIMREWIRRPRVERSDYSFDLGKQKLIHFLCFMFLCTLLQPIMALICITWPYCKLARLVFSPINCSVLHQLSFLTFMGIHVYVSLAIFIPQHSLAQWETTASRHSDAIIHPLLVYHTLWVIGSCFHVIRRMHYMGIRKYLSELWHVTMLLWYCTFLVIYTENLLEFLSIGEISDVRTRCLVSVTITIGVSHVLRSLQNINFTGKLIISFKKMIPDVIRFFIVFFIVGLSFGVSLYILYFRVVVDGEDSEMYSFEGTLARVMWALFGIHYVQYLYVSTLPAANSGTSACSDCVCNSTATSSAMVMSLDDRLAIEMFGIVIYCVNSIVILLVLLNLFIAMMSDTYAKVQRGIELDCRFIQTRYMMTFIDSGIKWNIPPPYNIIAWPWYTMLSIFGRCRHASDNHREEQSQRTSKRKLNYDTLMKALLCRYFERRDKKKKRRKESLDKEPIPSKAKSE
ncbi:short transient receptor potential channel 3-like [Ptychodera flava]|uniref:short transient receptor potential channel 3-like n=1 Tax=Ptychodera flava TaxID=63121 RepID=UPI00396A9CA1